MALSESYIEKLYNQLLNFSDKMSRNIHNAYADSQYRENYAYDNAHNFVNGFFDNKEVSTNEIEKIAKNFIESGQITKQDFDNYINNLFTGDLDYKRTLEMLDSQMAFNSAEAEKNRQWQTQMSNSAFQRQANDLKSAGYNPALLLGGSGASVMSVNTPYTATGGPSAISSSFTNIVSSALSANTQMSKGILGLLGNVFSSYLKYKAGGSTYNFYSKK